MLEDGSVVFLLSQLRRRTDSVVVQTSQDVWRVPPGESAGEAITSIGPTPSFGISGDGRFIAWDDRPPSDFLDVTDTKTGEKHSLPWDNARFEPNSRHLSGPPALSGDGGAIVTLVSGQDKGSGSQTADLYVWDTWR
jgi:hypothetical protein